MKLGVCYYPEHWPQERWSQDAAMMRQAGLTIVRIGEFAWQLMEPAPGRFTWAWLDLAIDTLALQGLQIVLGTPTATPPAWICKADPDILPVDAQGRRRRFGSRRHYCPNSPAYRSHTERIVRAMAMRYGRHPNVMGWQIDNEFGCHDTARCYCEHCAAAFRIWLQKRYGTLEKLNEAWGTAFWSQGYASWSEIDPPYLAITEPNPSHVVDYYRFSSDSVLAYQQFQQDLLRAGSETGKFITTNFMGNFPDLDYHALARPLDLVTWDSYPTGYAEIQSETLYLPDEPRPVDPAYDAGDPYVTGFCHDITRGLKQQPFWVMEQQAGHVNWSRYNVGVRAGTPRLWTWHAVAGGADAVVYFRWRACRYAQEQFHSGLLKQDATPDIGYEDLLALGKEKQLLDAVAAGPVDARVAILSDYQDLWALQLQPHRRDFGYHRHLFVYYRALARRGIPVDIVSPDADLSRYRLILAPTAFMADEKLAATLQICAEHGATVMLGVRSGFKTPTNIVTDQPLPGAFRSLAGVDVAAWHALPPEVSYPLSSGIPGLNEDNAAFWAEKLVPLDSKTIALVSYGDGPFNTSAALTKRSVGTGKVFYVGWYPTPEQAGTLISYLLRSVDIAPIAEPLPEGMLALHRNGHTILINFTEKLIHTTIYGRAVSVNPRDIKVIPPA